MADMFYYLVKLLYGAKVYLLNLEEFCIEFWGNMSYNISN